MINDELHKFRKYIDLAITSAEEDLRSETKQVYNYKREMQIVRTKLQEAKMWVGKCLEMAGSPFPAALADKADDNIRGIAAAGSKHPIGGQLMAAGNERGATTPNVLTPPPNAASCPSGSGCSICLNKNDR